MSDINLLPQQHKSNLKEDQVVLMLRRIAVVLLGAVAFISVVLFILTIQSPLLKEKQEEDALISKLSLSANRISRNVIIQERLISVSNILKERNTYDEYINSIIHQLPPNVSVSSLTVKKNTVQLSGNTTSLDAANIFFDNLIALKNKKETIAGVTLGSFSLQGELGKYFFTLYIALL